MSANAEEAAAIIRARTGLVTADAAILLGSQFYGLADLAETPVRVPYAELPGFPALDDGEVISCRIEGASTLVLKGAPRFHETGRSNEMASAIETLAVLNARTILAPAFATALRPDLIPGVLVSVTDHIALGGLNPLVGAPESFGVNMNEAYDKRLLRRLKMAAVGAGVNLHEGSMMWFSGPSFETAMENRMARMFGADIACWSIAPEAILARRYGVPFAGLAIVVDHGAGVLNGEPSGAMNRGPVISGLVVLRRLLRQIFK